MPGKILIYGGTGGIGLATARILRARGHELHLVARDEMKLASLADELGAGHTAGDVLQEELFSRVAEDAGDELVGLLYSVGSINLGSLRRLGADDFLADFRLNAAGAALAVKAALPAMKKSSQPASVVLLSSVAARQGFPMHTSMGMAKGAVNGLMLSLAAELAPAVRVNAIAPSLTNTPLAGKLLGSEARAKLLAELHPIPRLGAPEDVARLAVFLLSQESGWMTGQILGVDGGRSTLRPGN